jgi:hypothetical protein
MTLATVLNSFEWQKLRLTKSAVLRMLIAGSTWGLAMSAGLAGMSLWNDGMICLDDSLLTTAICIAAGVLAIGPIAAYGRR